MSSENTEKERERYTFTLHKETDKELYKFLKDKSVTKIAKLALEDYRKKVLGGEGGEPSEGSSPAPKAQIDSKEVMELAKEIAKELMKEMKKEDNKTNKNTTTVPVDDNTKQDDKAVKISKSAKEKLDWA
jgi:hypothetical protein